MKHTLLGLILILLFFGCDETQIKVPADSVVWVLKYNGAYSLPLPKPPKLGEKIEVGTYKNELLKKFPNYIKERDMELPYFTSLILDSTMKFHPTIEWETKREITGSLRRELINILECETGQETYDKPSPKACFLPRDGVVVWESGEIKEFYSICFECYRIKKDIGTENLSCVNWSKLGKALL